MNLQERLSTLRRVSLFADLPDPDLSSVARLLEEVTLSAGQTLFNKGDKGYSMYIIVEGQVRVHDGERTLNYLGRRDVFGEMSALAPEPRVASVTAVEDTHLLQLYQHPLYRLMGEQDKVMRGVIQVLCRHLRARVRDLVDEQEFHQEVAQLTRLTQASVEGDVNSKALRDIALRSDELGDLARSVQQLLDEIKTLRQDLNTAQSR